MALSRGEARDVEVMIRGSFNSRDDLRALDEYEIEGVVHLAAQLPECSEDVGLDVNVVGSARLLRHLIDRGCKHFVLASSIAAVGCLSEQFIARSLPISDDHPCDAVDAYGLSKALMEDLASYFYRQNPDLEITLLRIGGVLTEDFAKHDSEVLATARLPFLVGGLVGVQDVVEVAALALSSRLGPGVRRFNVVAEMARTAVPVPDALRTRLGDRAQPLDMTYYEEEGRQMASLYSIDRLRETYGFHPSIDPRPALEIPASGPSRGSA